MSAIRDKNLDNNDDITDVIRRDAVSLLFTRNERTQLGMVHFSTSNPRVLALVIEMQLIIRRYRRVRYRLHKEGHNYPLCGGPSMKINGRDLHDQSRNVSVTFS